MNATQRAEMKVAVDAAVRERVKPQHHTGERRCAGCDGDLAYRTVGCSTCDTRAASRRYRAEGRKR